MRERTTKFERDGYSNLSKSQLVSKLIFKDYMLDLHRSSAGAVYERALKKCVKAYAMAHGKMFTQADLDRIEQVFLEEAQKEIDK